MTRKNAKQIIFFLLIGIVIFLTGASSVYAKGNADKDWAKEYLKVIKKYKNDRTYGLIYLNNDDIPELLCEEKYYGMDVYGYENGKAYQIGAEPNYSGRTLFYYAKKKNIICAETAGSAGIEGWSTSWCYIKKVKRKKLVSQYALSWDLVLDKEQNGYVPSSYDYHAANDQESREISEAEFDKYYKIVKKCKPLEGKLSYSKMKRKLKSYL